MCENYSILIPITGYLEISVEAYNPDEAIKIALEQASLKYLKDWEYCREVVKDGVSQAMLNKIEWEYE